MQPVSHHQGQPNQNQTKPKPNRTKSSQQSKQTSKDGRLQHLLLTTALAIYCGFKMVQVPFNRRLSVFSAQLARHAHIYTTLTRVPIDMCRFLFLFCVFLLLLLLLLYLFLIQTSARVVQNATQLLRLGAPIYVGNYKRIARISLMLMSCGKCQMPNAAASVVAATACGEWQAALCLCRCTQECCLLHVAAIRTRLHSGIFNLITFVAAARLPITMASSDRSTVPPIFTVSLIIPLLFLTVLLLISTF